MKQVTDSRLKRSLLFSVFSTYVLVLLPLMAIITVTTVFFFQRLGDSNESASAMANNRLCQIADASLSNLRQLTISFFTDAELSNARRYEYKNSNPQELIVFNRIQKKLNTTFMSYDLLRGIYLYYPYSNTVLSNRGLYSGGTFAQYCESITGFTWQQLLDMQEYQGNFAYALSTGTDGKGRMLVLSRYQTQADSVQNILAWILVDADALIDTLLPMRYDSETQFALLNPANGASVGAEELSAQILQEKAVRLEEMHYKWKDYHVTVAASAIGSWYAVSFDLFTRFDHTMENILVLLAILTIICVLCLILAWHFGKRQVEPIRQIYQVLSEQNTSATADQLTDDIYKRIENGIVQMSRGLSDNRQMLVEKQNHIKSMMLLRILRNRTLDQVGVEWVLNNYGIELEGPSYRVLSVGIEQLPDVAKAQEDESCDVEFALMNLTEVAVSSFLEPDFQLNVAMDNTRFVFVINGSPAGVRGDALCERLNRAWEYLKANHGIDTIFALGEAHDTRDELSLSYNEASAVLEYARMTGKRDGLYTYTEITVMPNAKISFERTVSLRGRFMNQMSIENYSDAKQTLTEILSTGESAQDNGIGEWRMQLLLAESMLSGALMDNQALSSSGFSERYLADVQKLRQAKNLQEAAAILDAIFSEMEAQQKKTSRSASAIISDVLAYVQDNYCSSDLSIGGIAAQLDVSISYISRQFKQIYGVGMLDYVHRLRINKAKQLLAETEESIKSISEQVGYINALTMTRSFKRYEGILPSEYRSISGKK